jgi:glycolate oxidase FAD binding subunit
MGISTQAALREALASLVSTPVRPAADSDAVAGVRPQVVVEPASEEEVAAVLAFADREGLAVLPRGGGTQLALGCPAARGDILLSTARLTAVLEHEPHDQTVAMQAGMRLADLQWHLGRARQWLALDPALADGATLGGIISSNATGARRLRFGGVRDQIIGVRVALPDGTIARGGGKVVKNVAGYDLPKLFCGALGTLGVVVAANFRVYPLPALTRTLTLAAPDPAALCALVLTVNASTLVPTALDVLGPGVAAGDACTLAVRFESGVRAAVEDQSAALLALAGDLATSARTLEGEDEAVFWRRADDAIRPEPGSAAVHLKASLLPTEIAGWLVLVTSVTAEAGLAAHWRVHAGHGIAHVRLAGPPEALVTAVEPLRRAAAEARGSVVVEHAPPELLPRLDVWGPIPALAVMRQLKARFDPHGTLNPGRFVGGI